jgi:hypothetical protein
MSLNLWPITIFLRIFRLREHPRRVSQEKQKNNSRMRSKSHHIHSICRASFLANQVFFFFLSLFSIRPYSSSSALPVHTSVGESIGTTFKVIRQGQRGHFPVPFVRAIRILRLLFDLSFVSLHCLRVTFSHFFGSSSLCCSASLGRRVCLRSNCVGVTYSLLALSAAFLIRLCVFQPDPFTLLHIFFPSLSSLVQIRLQSLQFPLPFVVRSHCRQNRLRFSLL